MLGNGFFINNSMASGSGSNRSDVTFENGKILFSPIDNIYIDQSGNVFYSNDNTNAILTTNDSGNIVVRKVI